MRRSTSVRLTLLPLLASAAMAHLQTGCVEEPEDAANAPENGVSADGGAPVRDVDDCLWNDSDDTCDRASRWTAAVGQVSGVPVPYIPAHRGGFGNYFGGRGG